MQPKLRVRKIRIVEASSSGLSNHALQLQTPHVCCDVEKSRRSNIIDLPRICAHISAGPQPLGFEELPGDQSRQT